MVYGGAINSLMGFANRKGQQEGYRMNGTTECTRQEDFDDDRES